MACFNKRKLLKLEHLLLLLLLLQICTVSAKNGKIKVNKNKLKTAGGVRRDKVDTNRVYEDSESRYVPDNETDDLAFNLPDEQILISELLGNYDVASRPVFNASMPVVVKFNFALIQIIDMDERNQILTTNVWIEHVNN